MSRFAYHPGADDQPLEGGVRAATPKKQPARSTGRPHAASNGVPGPEETLLDITELVRNIGMHYVHRFALPPDYEPELSATSPVVGTITLTNTGATLLLRGKATAQLATECGRCLETRVEEVEAELEESYDLVTGHGGRHHEEVCAVDSENPEAPVIEANILKLGELLRQALLVAAPLSPTCPDDCPNLIKLKSRFQTDQEGGTGSLSRLGELLKAAGADSVL